MMRDLFRRNPLAVVLAVVMHLVILLFLAVGVDWWRTPKPITSQVEVVQARLIETEPVPPKPVAQPRPVKTGPSEAGLQELRKLEQARQRAEVERQRKLAAEKATQEKVRRKAEEEKQRQAELQKQQEAERRAKAEVEKKRREQQKRAAEKAKAEKAKKEAERKKAELERQRKLEAEKKRKAEEERRRKAKAKAAAEAKAKAEAEARAKREADLASRLQAEEDAREKQRTILAIQQKIERNWLRPPGTAGRGLRCEVRVRLSSRGLVILASVVKSSGNAAFDRSVISAVEKSEPLPMPSSARLAAEFRDIVFEFDPGK